MWTNSERIISQVGLSVKANPVIADLLRVKEALYPPVVVTGPPLNAHVPST